MTASREESNLSLVKKSLAVDSAPKLDDAVGVLRIAMMR